MPNIERQSNKLPAILRMDLVKHLFLNIRYEHDAIELIISINETGINIKELSSYLDFIYQIDGRLSEIGYARYSHRPQYQIEIDEIRFGSWEIVIERLIESVDAEKLGIIFLSLKFLPSLVKTAIGTAKSYYEIMNTREDYLEKRDKRKNRKEIRTLINEEAGLLTLEKSKREKLVDLLEDIYKSNSKKLPAASRLAQKSIKEVRIMPANKKNRNS